MGYAGGGSLLPASGQCLGEQRAAEGLSAEHPHGRVLPSPSRPAGSSLRGWMGGCVATTSYQLRSVFFFSFNPLTPVHQCCACLTNSTVLIMLTPEHVLAATWTLWQAPGEQATETECHRRDRVGDVALHRCETRAGGSRWVWQVF